MFLLSVFSGGVTETAAVKVWRTKLEKEAFAMKTKLKQRLQYLLAVALSVCMMLSIFPATALAAEEDSQNTMTFGEFLEAVKNENGTFDGKGVTVEWEPVSGCFYSEWHEDCRFKQSEWVHAVPETPVRVNQLPNAQYQIFDNLEDITLKNINFKFVPADFTICENSAWEGDPCSKDTTRNAELQFLNSGDLVIENCNFDQVMISPYSDGNNTSPETTFKVTGCTFANVYDAYTLKDIYPAAAIIEGNTFKDCSGAIYFEGAVERKSIRITNNTFSNVDTYAEKEKENTHGIIQFSAQNRLSSSTELTIANNTITGNLVNDGVNNGKLPVIRQLCDLNGVEIKGWTPGAAFSIRNTALFKTVILPDMPSNSNYTFMGWAKASDYKGPTDLTNLEEFLKPGDSASFGYYYAVWEAKEIRYTVTVENSYADWTGAGSYLPGERVVINAGTPDGMEFASWTTDSPITLVDTDEPVTSFIMPACNVTVVANWKGTDEDRGDPYLKINKLWAGDDEDIRPESVKVNVYHEDDFYRTVIIYEKYEWMGGTFIPARWEDDVWWVEEADVPEEYNSEVEQVRHLVFDVTNTYDPA